MSSFADEGTIAHALAAMCLETGKDASAFIGRIIEAEDHPHSKLSPSSASRWIRCAGSVALSSAEEFKERKFSMEVTVDMANDVQIYVDAIRHYANGNHLFIESRIDLSEWLGADQGGTSDAGILTADGEEIQVHDLKFGKGVRVDAEENEQLQLYALGFYQLLQMIGFADNVKRVRMVIHQPRLGHQPEWDCTLDELLAFGERARAAAQTALGLAPADVAGYLNPGEKQCRWCKAKATCPALAAEVSRTVLDDFDVIGDPTREVKPVAIPDQNGALLGTYMDRLELIEDWCRAVRARAEAAVLAGVEVVGSAGPYKIVAGKKGNRAWQSADAATEAMKSMRLKHEEMYSYSLISPTQAEKLLKKESPKRWKKLEALVFQPEGKKHIAPANDPRPALAAECVADDFEDLTGE